MGLKKLRITALILLISLTFITKISADDESEWFNRQAGGGFYQGRFLIEANGGGLRVDVTTPSIARSEHEIWSDYNIIINSTNANRRASSLIKVVNQKHPETIGATGRIAFEYALFDFLGVGISYSQSRIRTKNLRVDELEELDLFFLNKYGSGFTNPSTIHEEPGIHDAIDIIGREKNYQNLHSVDLELGIHPLQGKIDPYIKLAFGLDVGKSGLDYRSNSRGLISRNRSRFGVLAGVRAFMGESFFFSIEGFAYDYPDNILDHGLMVSLHSDYGVRLGLGFGL